MPGLPRKRLKPVVLAVTVGDKNISEFCEMSIRDELKFIAENEPNLTEKQRQIGGQIMKEIRNRLQFLQSVGLDYLTLARAPAHCPAARASESASPPRSEVRCPACSMCWTSPASACTSAITTSSLRP